MQLAVVAGTTFTVVLGASGSASAEDVDGCAQQYSENVTHSFHDPIPKVTTGQPGQVGIDASGTILYADDAANDTVNFVGCLV